MTKICLGCAQDLPLTEYRSPNGKHRQARCRECERVYGRNYMKGYRKRMAAERLARQSTESVVND